MAGSNQATQIRVRQGTRADIDDAVRVHFQAFGPGIMNRLMYPDGVSDDARSQTAAPLTKIFDDAGSTAESNQSQPKAYESFLIVAEAVPGQDRSSAEAVAFAYWDVWRKPRSEEEWDVVEPIEASSGEETSLGVADEFLGGIRAMRRRRMRGDPSICLRTLVCTPTRGRLGAGSALLRWGTDLADREGLPCWLEASPQAYPLYRRFGFEDAEVFDLNVGEKWGAVRRPNEDWGANVGVELAGVAPEGVYRTVGMWRLPVRLDTDRER